jgi:hypothetical protein
MAPSFLISEAVIREDGASAELDLGSAQGKLLLLTLGITRIIEQESLDVSIWGSPDNVNWGPKPLVAFPQKFYCGTYQILLDLSERQEVQYLRAKWKVSRWGHGEPKPLFGLYLFLQETEPRMLAKSA